MSFIGGSTVYDITVGRHEVVKMLSRGSPMPSQSPPISTLVDHLATTQLDHKAWLVIL